MIRRSHTTTISAVSALAAALVLTGCSSPEEPASEAAGVGLDEVSPEVTQAAEDFEGTFTYWTGLTFPEESNALELERIEVWAERVGVDVEVLPINQNEVVQQVSGALEAGSLPTAMTVPYDLLQTLGPDGQLVPVDETYAQVGEDHGGWLEAIDTATKAESFGGSVYGVPFGFFGSVLFQRSDLLDEAGFTDAPATWEELVEQAAAVSSPPDTYGMGFAVSNVLDGNLTTAMMQSFGGRVANDDATQCTIDSPETAEFLEWFTSAWEDGLFPPSAVTWDGAGDNNSYLSGESAFIANTGSVYLSMLEEDPELAESTRFSALPAGPAEQVSPVDPRYRVIPSTTSEAGQVLANDLFKAMADDEYMAEYMANATYGPVLNSQLEYPIFTDSPVHAGLLDLAEKGTAPAYPDVATAAYSDYQNSFATPRMVQRVIVDGVSIEDAMAEAQASCQSIYDNHNG